MNVAESTFEVSMYDFQSSYSAGDVEGMQGECAPGWLHWAFSPIIRPEGLGLSYLLYPN